MSDFLGPDVNAEYHHNNPYIIITQNYIDEDNDNSTNHQFLRPCSTKYPPESKQYIIMLKNLL